MYPGPELPAHELATLDTYDTFIAKLDGVQPPACDSCSFLLKAGKHRIELSFRQVGIGTQVRSRNSRIIEVTLTPAHQYLLVTGSNLTLDDWFVLVLDKSTNALVLSDRDKHCPTCPRTQ